MADYGHELTDYELSKLEKEIGTIYEKAGKKIGKKINAYFRKFSKLDEEKKAQVAAGEMTEQEYKNWRVATMARGEEYERMRDEVAEDMTEANASAWELVAAAMLGIYVLNRNYAAYRIERLGLRNKDGTKIAFELFEEDTARGLLKKDGASRRYFDKDMDLMPYYSPVKALQRGIDLSYGKKQINKAVLSSILQGKSIPKIADDLQARIVSMERASAVRTARTATTCAENAGHMDTYKDAETMGIPMEKVWIATLDSRTRHTHRQMDRVRVAVDDTFPNGCRFPGDSRGRPEEVYNCRCTLLGVPKGISINMAVRANKLNGMTYEEWKAAKARGK